MEEKFIFRYYTPVRYWDGKVPRATVVGVHEDGMLKVAVSRCSESDMFSRQKGRFIAEKRLQEGKFFAMFPMKECKVKTFIPYAQIVSHLVCNDPRVIETTKETEKEKSE